MTKDNRRSFENRGTPYQKKPQGMPQSPAEVKPKIAASRGIIEPASEDPYAPNDNSQNQPKTPNANQVPPTNTADVPETPPDAPVEKEEPGLECAENKKIEKKFNSRCRLFIANIASGVTEDEVKALFLPYGDVGEIFVNKDKGFGFIRMDYRHNAVKAKQLLDKVIFRGRVIQVRYATQGSAIELHGLNQFASNESIVQAMSQFGQVERCTVVCDERGRSKGFAIVEFLYKRSAQKVLERLRDELFVLGRLPKPVFAKPYTETDDEEGIFEDDLQKINGYEGERECPPRFIAPNSPEFEYACRWRNLFLEEEDKKRGLAEEMKVARYNLEVDMEHGMQEKEAMRMREELMRKQEELRQFEEQLIRRRESSKIQLPEIHASPMRQNEPPRNRPPVADVRERNSSGSEQHVQYMQGPKNNQQPFFGTPMDGRHGHGHGPLPPPPLMGERPPNNEEFEGKRPKRE